MTLEQLMRKFGQRFYFTTARMRDHRSLVALRRAGTAEPGLQVVITDKLSEMNAALEQDQRGSELGGPHSGP